MRKVRLDFSDFWPGYQKTNNFFYNFLKRHFEVELCDQPDFLIYADPLSHVHRVYNCVKIYVGIESYLPDFRQCDYAFTCHYLDHPRHFRLPLYVWWGLPQLLQKHEHPAEIIAGKTKFCSFIVSNAKARKRIDFFQRLSKYRKVDSAGAVLNNVGSPIAHGSVAKIEFLKPYKFNIAFENASLAGYTTEKIVEAMRARALPIYWGNPRIQEEFNSKSFLNYNDFANEEALIERIIQLDQNDLLYQEYLAEPYFINNIPNQWFSEERLLAQFEKIFANKIRPVSQKRKLFSFGRWALVQKCKPHGPCGA